MVSIAPDRERKAGIVRVVLSLKQDSIRKLFAELLGNQLDVEVIAQVDDPIELLLAVKRSNAQVVVLSWLQEETPPAICSHLLAEFPELLIIGISQAQNGILCRQTVTTSALGPITEKTLLAAIRSDGTTTL